MDTTTGHDRRNTGVIRPNSASARSSLFHSQFSSKCGKTGVCAGLRLTRVSLRPAGHEKSLIWISTFIIPFARTRRTYVRANSESISFFIHYSSETNQIFSFPFLFQSFFVDIYFNYNWKRLPKRKTPRTPHNAKRGKKRATVVKPSAYKKICTIRRDRTRRASSIVVGCGVEPGGFCFLASLAFQLCGHRRKPQRETTTRNKKRTIDVSKTTRSMERDTCAKGFPIILFSLLSIPCSLLRGARPVYLSHHFKRRHDES